MVEIRTLGPDELERFLTFLDGPAFKSQPKWSGCYCQFYLEDVEQVNWEEQSAERNREKTCDRVASGEMRGYVAVLGDRTIGWVAANSANNFKAFPKTQDDVARILCFIVDQDFQNQGIAGRLLDYAIEDLAKQGFKKIEAAPKVSDSFDPSSYRGTLSMFLKRGFIEGAMQGDHHRFVHRELTD